MSEIIYCKVVVNGHITEIYRFESHKDYYEVSDDMQDGEEMIKIPKSEFDLHYKAMQEESDAKQVKSDKDKEITVNYIMDEESYSEEEDNLRLKIITLDYFKSKTAASLTEIKSIYKWLKDDSV